jgi:hypothetical protein
VIDDPLPSIRDGASLVLRTRRVGSQLTVVVFVMAIRHGRFVLVCIAGLFGAWNVKLLTIDGIISNSNDDRHQVASLKEWLSLKPSQNKTFSKEEEAIMQEELDGFPITRFTPHVQELVKQYDFDRRKENCMVHFHLERNPKDESWPMVQCTNTEERGRIYREWWCIVLKRTLWSKGRVLPYKSVDFSVSPNDYLWKREANACLASSNDGGNFTIINFLEIRRMRFSIHYSSLPWEQRSSRPIFRGSPWVNEKLYAKLDRTTNDSNIFTQVLNMSPRLKAVDWSLRHPSLLDARVHRGPNVDTESDSIWFANSTTGLHKLLVTDSIPMEQYYAQHQVALVLCGIGAAFRTSIHFETTTTVVLQDCPKQEWFTGMLVPFQHYIPLKYDLGDLQEKMNWVRNHPREVRSIAENGRRFYDDYLSFERNEEHIYEFVYRLALKKAQYDSKRHPMGTNDTSTV